MTYHYRYSPRFTNLPKDGKLHVKENSTFVIDVQSEDNRGSEQNGQLRYSIIGGVDADFFKIDPRTGVLEFRHPPDFENDQSRAGNGDNIYDVKIQVEDAAHYTAQKTLWIQVKDVDENDKPKFTNLPADGRLEIHENTTFVIDANASDDRDREGDGLRFEVVGGADSQFFEIDATTGELSFVNPPDFENDQSRFGGNNIYDVVIRVIDSHGAFHDKPLWVKVKDKDETGSVGDKVFFDADRDGIQDAGEQGVEGVTVELLGAGNDGVFGTADDITESTVTDENGNYTFDNLGEGDYKVTFSNLPDGLEFTTQDAPGSNFANDSDADPVTGMTDVFSLGAGQVIDTVDAGLVAPVTPGSIGDTVFNDLDGDGIQDPGEPGVEGVTVTITGAGDDGVIGTDDDTETVVVTDANGNYSSGPLDPGDYKVTFSDLPDGFEFTTQDAGGDDALDSDVDPTNGMTDVFTLAEGEVNNDVDAGLVDPVAPASLGDTVFLDENGNGVQDPGEDGVEGVTVTITGAGDDGVIGTDDDTETVVVTDANGNYSSGPLDPGDYKVTFSDLPDGFEFTTPDQGGDDALDSDVDPTNGMTDVITLGEGEVNNDIDAGLVAPVVPARLGNRVFDDRNQNGIQDRGEQGVGGVTVTLTGGGEDGIIGTDDDTEEVQVTRTRGNYFFNGLIPGVEYQVTFSDLPDGFVFTTPDQGNNDARDSDADPTTGSTGIIVLAPGEVNATVDAGIVLDLQTDDKNIIRGTIAPDFLSGTVADDDIRGLGDSDTILGFEGDDCLFGNGGFDVIRGGAGSDSIFGGQEDDTLRGDGGSDILAGGTGNDVLFGGSGRDTLDGTNGSGANELDTLAGNGGSDLFVLGDALTQYYIAAGDDDFATINGFNADADALQLNGVADDYQTQQNGADLELLSNGELIAVFSNTADLDINAVGRFV